jgi:hypothetical protein
MSYLKQQMHRSVFGMVAIALLMVGSAAHAADPGQWNFQVYGGWYFPGDLQKLNDVDGSLQDTLDTLGIEPEDSFTYGARIGKRQTPTFGW